MRIHTSGRGSAGCRFAPSCLDILPSYKLSLSQLGSLNPEEFEALKDLCGSKLGQEGQAHVLATMMLASCASEASVNECVTLYQVSLVAIRCLCVVFESLLLLVEDVLVLTGQSCRTSGAKITVTVWIPTMTAWKVDGLNILWCS